MHFIPVESILLVLIVEKAILFIYNLPQCLKVIFRRIAGNIFPYTGIKDQKSGQSNIYNTRKSFHKLKGSYFKWHADMFLPAKQIQVAHEAYHKIV